MGAIRRWWDNENYDREHMARFRHERSEWSDLPDEVAE